MNFKYLKLSLLAITLSGPFIIPEAKAANLQHAINLFLGLTDIKAPQRNLDETINILNEIINSLQDDTSYASVCNDLRQLQEALRQYKKAASQARNALGNLQEKLQAICGSIEADLQNRLNKRIQELKDMNYGTRAILLSKFGISKLDIAFGK